MFITTGRLFSTGIIIQANIKWVVFTVGPPHSERRCTTTSYKMDTFDKLSPIRRVKITMQLSVIGSSHSVEPGYIFKSPRRTRSRFWSLSFCLNLKFLHLNTNLTMNAKQIFVLDNGGFTLKAGLAGQTEPRSVWIFHIVLNDIWIVF